jgi:hypothetical protein
MSDHKIIHLWKMRSSLDDEELELYADMLPLIDGDVIESFEQLPEERRLSVFNRFINNEGTPMELILLELLMMLPEKERKRWLFNKRRKRLGL